MFLNIHNDEDMFKRNARSGFEGNRWFEDQSRKASVTFGTAEKM